MGGAHESSWIHGFSRRVGWSRFLQTDPVPGGSANDYDYAGQDPINSFDLDGRICWSCGWHHVTHAASSGYHWAGHHKLDIALTAVSFVPVAGEAAWLYRGYRVARVLRAVSEGRDITASRY